MSYWDLANTTADIVGRWASLGSNNLVESKSGGTETWNGAGAYIARPSAPPAVEGNSFSLTGSNYIEVGNLGATDDTVTYCGWVYDDGATGAPDPIFYDRTSNCGLHTFDSTRWGYTWNADPGTYNWANGPTRSPGEWVYIALRIDGANFKGSIRTRSTAGVVKFVENTGVGHASMAYVPNLMIGADTVLPDRRFVGRLNDLRIYNRVLSDAELDDIAAGPEPTNTVAPVVILSGSVLTCTTSAGDWNSYSNGTPTFAYQWQHFSGSWSNISGAILSTYTPTLSGDYRCVVTASNNGGSHVGANSNTITVAFPTISVSPVVSQTGAVLNSTNGTWTGSPLSYSYQWYYEGYPVPSATSAAHTPIYDGAYECRVSATNALGTSAPAPSNSVTVNLLGGLKVLPPRSYIMSLAQLRFKMTAAAPNDPVGAYKTANPGWVSTPVGAPTYEDRPVAYLGDADSRAIVLNGSSQKLTLPSLNGLSFPSSTLGCWVKRNGNQVAFAQAIGWRGKNQLHIANSTAQQRLAYNFNGTIGQYNWDSGLFVFDDEWEYLAVSSRPATGVGQAYVNSSSGGVEYNSNITTHTAYTAGAEVGGIGEDHNGGFNRWVNGRLFEPALWIPALTDSQMEIVAGGVEPTFTNHLRDYVIVSGPDINNEWYFEFLPPAVDNKGAATIPVYFSAFDPTGFQHIEDLTPGDNTYLGPGTYIFRAQVTSVLGAVSQYNDPNSFFTLQLPAPSFTNKVGVISKSDVQAGVALGTSDATVIEALVRENYGDADKLSMSGGQVILTDATPKSSYKFILAGELIVVNVIEDKTSYLNSETDTLAQTVASSLYSFPSVNKGLNPMSGANYSGRFKGGSK